MFWILKIIDVAYKDEKLGMRTVVASKSNKTGQDQFLGLHKDSKSKY